MIYLRAVKKSTSISLTLLTCGMIILIPSIFAEAIGLDKNPGDWSRARIVIFAVGIFFIGIAGIYYQFSQQIGNVISSIRPSNQQNKIIIWLSKHKFIKETSRIVSDYILIVLIPILILILYIWLASSGTWIMETSHTTHYSNLAEGFLEGNLNLSLKPDSQILAMQNPYDPSTRGGLGKIGDLSLYNGKFYMYWGPVPAIFVAIFLILLKIQIEDSIIGFIFVCGIFLAQTALLHAIWKRCFAALPKWTLHLAVLSGGLITPIILLRHNYISARIHEAAIAGGQFFLLSGFSMAFLAVSKKSISTWRLASASLLWVLAIGTRHVLVAPIGVMVVLISIWLLYIHTTLNVKLMKFIALGCPLILGAFALAWYNWARFGSITETGFSYALASVDLQKHAHALFSNSYIVQNLYNYLLNPPGVFSKFPFVSILKGSEIPILPFIPVPEFYNAQPITGSLYIFPFSIFTLVPLIVLSARLFKKRSSDQGNEQMLIDWVTLNMGGSSLIALSLLTFFFWAGMRYSGDFMPSLLIVSILGFWQGYQYLESNLLAKNLFVLIGVILAGSSAIVSILLIISTDSKLVNLIIKSIQHLKTLADII